MARKVWAQAYIQVIPTSKCWFVQSHLLIAKEKNVL